MLCCVLACPSCVVLCLVCCVVCDAAKQVLGMFYACEATAMESHNGLAQYRDRIRLAGVFVYNACTSLCVCAALCCAVASSLGLF